MPVSSILRGTAVLGLGDNSVRVALARLKAAGLVEVPRRGHYRLGREAKPLQEQIVAWRRVEDRVVDWTGRWVGAHSSGQPRDDRRALRRHDRALRLLGMRELRPGLHVRPDNLDGGTDGVRERLDELGILEGTPVFALSDMGTDHEQEARGLWDGESLTRGYEKHRKKLERTADRLDKLPLEDAARETFMTGAEAIRRLVFDPLLPEPIVDAEARRQFLEKMKEFDKLGRTIWNELLS